MQPPTEEQLAFAESVAKGHREAASLCLTGQEALRARFVQGADTIDQLVAQVRWFSMAAKLNHDTIRARAEA